MVDRALPAGGTRPGDFTLEEERREILVGVLGALITHAPGPDEMAACSRLLQHLSKTAGLLA